MWRAATSRTSTKEPEPIVLGIPGAPEKIDQMGCRVILRREGSVGRFTGGPVTTPGLTAEIENGG